MDGVNQHASGVRASFKSHPLARRLGLWAVDLLLIFIGVYAAFWLNSYQERQRDLKRHDIILATLEQEAQTTLAVAAQQAAAAEKAGAAFRRALAAGEMPPLEPFSFVSDYSPTDIATLLQAGGVELLDPRTLHAVRNVQSTIRAGLGQMARFEKLSDLLLVPNMDEPPSFFYDPETHQLRKRFARYPEGIDSFAKFFRELEAAQTELLQQLKAERRR